MAEEGIKVRCICCRRTKNLPFEEASALKEPPMCDNCYMPMMAVEATVKGTKK